MKKIINKWSLPENTTLKVGLVYPYYTEISDISDLIKEYIDTSLNELYEKQFKNDR